MRRRLPHADRVPAVALLVCLTVALWGCGSGVSSSGAGDRRQAARYAAADAAYRSGDYDRAIATFQALGSFRDAPRRLVAVKAGAAAALLARARSKLAAGHPRAAVALAQTATSHYGDTSGAGRALLAQAERAQSAHHQAQLAGKAPG